MSSLQKIRQEAVERLLDGAGHLFPLDVLSKSLEDQGWVVHPVYFRAKIIGAIIERNGEIHTSISPKYQRHWNPRPYVKSILIPALEKLETILSDAARNDVRAQRWLEKLGFVRSNEDQERIYYQLTKESLRIY